MARAEATVEELVSMIERGELRLPEMQRRYVWKSTRVRDLMDSLYRGYPSGAILIWDTDEHVPLQDFSVSQRSNPYQSVRLLLDGQQRLTSLSSVIRGEPVSVRGRRRPIDLLFNLDHPDQLELVTEVDEEEDDSSLEDDADSTEDELQQRFNKMTFVVFTKKLAKLPNWVSVTDVFKNSDDAAILKSAGVTGFDDPNYKKYTERLTKLRNIRKYVYRMDVLERSLSYEEVTEIFVRVNSLGAKLRGSDLALAQITARWRNSLATFQKFQSECSNRGFEYDLGLYLRALMAFATGQCRFGIVGRLSLDQLQTCWKASIHGMEFAFNFLRNNVGITSPALLSSPFILVTIAYYGFKNDYSLSAPDAAQLAYWAKVTNAKGRYSRGSSETLLDQDLASIREGGKADALLARLKAQVGNLTISPDELAGRNRRSALYKSMFLAFRAKGAKDWISNLRIDVDHSGSAHKLQDHHIFPKAYLKKLGRTPRECDDIVNFAFISGKTNRKISDKAPSDYLPQYIKSAGQECFENQCIPTDPTLLSSDGYQDFLAKRRELVADCLNNYLKADTTFEA